MAVTRRPRALFDAPIPALFRTRTTRNDDEHQDRLLPASLPDLGRTGRRRQGRRRPRPRLPADLRAVDVRAARRQEAEELTVRGGAGRPAAMTPLAGSLKRQLDLDGVAYTLTLDA